MTHQSSLIIYKTDDSIVSSLPSCKCIFITPFLRVILREERSFRCLGKYFRKRISPYISAWGQLWAEMGIGGAGSREWGQRGGDESGSGSSFLSKGPSHQLAHGWSVEGRVIFVTWRGRRCSFILTSASFAALISVSLLCLSELGVCYPSPCVSAVRGKKLSLWREGWVKEKATLNNQPRVKFGLAPICKRFKNTLGPFSAFAHFFFLIQQPTPFPSSPA